MTASPATRVDVARAGTAVTRWATADEDPLISAPTPRGTACFVRGGDGLVGWGTYARMRTTGAGASERIQAWFNELCADLRVDDAVLAAGTGPVAFVSLGFTDADESVAVVPAVLLGRRGVTRFTTTVGHPPLIEREAVRAPGRIRYADAALPVTGFSAAVAAATARIRAGDLDKVVLAHDLEATTEHPVDERFLLGQLARSYPSCWTFAVDGLLGASPEMLIRRAASSVSSRVLAGTAWPDELGAPVADELLANTKDLAEHAYAVRSVADVLAPLCSSLTVPATPEPLELANLTHLSTDIVGELSPAARLGVRADRSVPGALELAAMLHPSAAVGGSPTGVALEVIAELEPMRRGRYAAPVGWMDAAGNGEFAIALRCAEVSGRNVRLMAGCGIVADSDPATEAREAQVKMVPIRDALEARA